jgi:flagellar basal-body rod protein FlgB
MGISLDDALGVSPYALQTKLDRAQVIASNLANVDTPGYLAQDLDYQVVMGDVARQQRQGETVSPASDSDLLYRIPYQTSQDGNTVELQVEQSKFAANSVAFDTSLTFLNLTFKGLTTAIEGS